MIRNFFRRLDLQAKILLVLIAVILPTYFALIFMENKLTVPVLEQEMKQVAINAAKNLAGHIESNRLFFRTSSSKDIENHIQDLFYWQPSIARVDVVQKDEQTGAIRLIASNIEQESGTDPVLFPLPESTVAEYKTEEDGVSYWEVVEPIRVRHKLPAVSTNPIIGAVRLQISLKTVDNVSDAFWKISLVAAIINVIVLILALSYFLRRTIENDRLLKRAESQNLELTAQLHEAERQLMQNEKLAVMGQLTASFAHEIGTPLNAVGGHLQLLREEIPMPISKSAGERLDIITSQLLKIENIVKSFLQSTAKPVSQFQLVDVNQVAERVVAIVRPRIETLKIDVQLRLDKSLGPVRAVPVDMEQILLNLVNNSLDSIQSKLRAGTRSGMQLKISSALYIEEAENFAEITIQDTGEGISKANLANVFKPFFTTKAQGEGTGLGLAICQQLASKYNAPLLIDSKEGAWTKLILRIPYRKFV